MSGRHAAGPPPAEDILSLPLYRRSMKDTWEPGERVEAVSGGYGVEPPFRRPGTVVAVEDYVMRHERLVVAFDDGETRAINPGVMRHRREEKTP